MLVATTVVILFLPLAGLVIERAYVASLDSRLEEQLKIQTYALMGLADELEPGQLWLPEALPDERFNQLASGRYAQLFSDNGSILWRSQSAASIELPNHNNHLAETIDPENLGTFLFSRFEQENSEPLQISEVTIIWEGPDDMESLYTFQVAESLLPYIGEIEVFRKTLILWLGGLGVILLLVNLGAMFWALKPFKQLSEAILDIESGKAEALDTNYPKELQQIANNINALITHERSQRQRYRNTLQDLAHSLKTPLSVLTTMTSEIQQPELKAIFQEQNDRMNKLVTYQLQRAVIGGEAPVKQRTLLAPEVEKLITALKKVYVEKELSFDIDVDPDTIIFGDPNDILEMIGNLCDNACKYGQSNVTVKSHYQTEENMVAIDVIDDGDGIPEPMRKAIFERGKRLDESAEGQGIGLAVVQDIVKSYRGKIQWPEQGSGHCVRLILPGSRETRQQN